MSNLSKRSLVGALLLAMCTMASPLLAKEKSEDQLIQDLASPDADKVAETLQHLEKGYPTSTKSFPAIKKLLADQRPKVRRKAARVLGALHAQVDEANLKDICALLKSTDTAEIVDGLKSLRGLKASSTVPEILPLLKHDKVNVVRDACRTLSVLGDKGTIPAIEPLVSNPDPKIHKDAEDAIYILRSK
jgi:HEAT repeat protein